MYTPGLRETLNTTHCPWAGLKPEPLNLEVSKVTLRPPHCASTGEDKSYFEKWCTSADFTFKSKTYSHWRKTLISFPFFGRRHTSSELFTVWTNLWHQNFPREVLWIYQVSCPYTWPNVLLMLIRISATQPPLFLFNCFFVFWTDFIHMIKL